MPKDTRQTLKERLRTKKVHDRHAVARQEALEEQVENNKKARKVRDAEENQRRIDSGNSGMVPVDSKEEKIQKEMLKALQSKPSVAPLREGLVPVTEAEKKTLETIARLEHEIMEALRHGTAFPKEPEIPEGTIDDDDASTVADAPPLHELQEAMSWLKAPTKPPPKSVVKMASPLTTAKITQASDKKSINEAFNDLAQEVNTWIDEEISGTRRDPTEYTDGRLAIEFRKLPDAYVSGLVSKSGVPLISLKDGTLGRTYRKDIEVAIRKYRTENPDNVGTSPPTVTGTRPSRRGVEQPKTSVKFAEAQDDPAMAMSFASPEKTTQDLIIKFRSLPKEYQAKFSTAKKTMDKVADSTIRGNQKYMEEVVRAIKEFADKPVTPTAPTPKTPATVAPRTTGLRRRRGSVDR